MILGLGNEFGKQLEALGIHLGQKECKSCDVAYGAGEIADEIVS